MRSPTLLALVLVLAAVVPLAGTADARSSPEPLQINVEKEFVGEDTYMFSIRSQSDFQITKGSHFLVQGHFANNGSDYKQDAATARGVIEYQSGLDCPPSDGFDPCFMDATGLSIKDAWDARVQAGAFQAEQDADAFAWGSVTDGVYWDSNETFELPSTADQLTIRFFVSVPDADRIQVSTHIHSPRNLSVHGETVTDTGFMANGDDFEPEAGADTAPASAMVDGRETVDLADGDRLYAAFGPSWYGTTGGGFFAGTHNTAAASNIAHEEPDGDRTAGTAVSAGSWSGILLPGTQEAGTHAFEVNAHAGVGPQDVYLVGWER